MALVGATPWRRAASRERPRLATSTAGCGRLAGACHAWPACDLTSPRVLRLEERGNVEEAREVAKRRIGPSALDGQREHTEEVAHGLLVVAGRVSGVPAVQHRDVIEHLEFLARLEEAVEQVAIFALVEAFVERAQRVERGLPKQGGAETDAPNGACPRARGRAKQDLVDGVRQSDLGLGQGELGVSFEPGQLEREAASDRDVIGVEERHQVRRVGE